LNRLIITALRDEAEPFIDHFKLAKDKNQSDLRVFNDENCSLLITGVGVDRVKVLYLYFWKEFLILIISYYLMLVLLEVIQIKQKLVKYIQ